MAWLRGAQVLEAGEDLRAHGLLEHDLRAAEGVAAEAAVAHHHLGDEVAEPPSWRSC